MLTYPIWYRQAGTRRLQQLTDPVLNPILELALPRGSVYHFVPEDLLTFGVTLDDPLVKSFEGIVYTTHVTTLESDLGNPKPITFQMDKAIREYQRQNRAKLRLMADPETVMATPQKLVVVNYGGLAHTKRYTTSYFSNYYRWYNIQATLWKTVGRYADQYLERHQFVTLTLPTILPSLQALMRSEEKMDRQTLEKLRDERSYAIAEIWHWLGDNREGSMMSVLNKDALNRINLIFKHYDKWCVINLGLLNAWRKGPDNPEGLEPKILQKRFLRSMMSIFESRTITDVEEQPTEPLEEDTTELDGSDDEDGPTTISSPKDKPVDTQVATDVSRTEYMGVEISDQEFKDEQDQHLKEDLAQVKDQEGEDDQKIDQQLEGLNDIAKAKEEQKSSDAAIVLIDTTPKPRDLTRGMVDKANELADAGLVSGGEYRKLIALSENMVKLPDPYNPKGVMGDFIKIDPATIKLEKSAKLPDNPNVLDKSMLQSTLLDFDSKYINHVMKKDIVNSVVSIQNAGVAVTGYEVEEVEDLMSHYEIHTVRLTPASGRSSTIRFRVPVVNEDGTYVANGVRYRLRKQRGDMPIRKVSSTRVSLTSYYGKTFVNLSEKVVNNYATWLTNQVMALGLDDKNETVTKLRPSNVFKQNYKVPKVYSSMAQRFRSFTLGGINFYFDYAKREVEFGKDAIASSEKGGMVVVGSKGNQIVTIDESGNLYQLTPKGEKPIGTFEDLLGVNREKAPIEVAELKVFNKNIPIGLVLSYYIGLENLIESLKPTTYRRVKTGERLNLNDGEYAIRFNDESLVFHRDDRLVTMVLGGFNNFHRQIKPYSVYDFDRKDVYLNVLEGGGIGILTHPLGPYSY